MGWPFKSKHSRYERMRNAERHGTHGLRCVLGELLDLSVTGLRAKSSQKPTVAAGTLLPLLIQNESQSVRVQGYVMWVRKVRLSEWQVGVRFIDVKPGIVAALDQLSRFGCINASVVGDDSASKSGSSASRSGEVPANAAVMVEDLYLILGVTPNADPEVIREKYHELALKYHPDRCPDPQAAEKFAVIGKAYAVLRDAGLRAKYDQMLQGATKFSAA